MGKFIKIKKTSTEIENLLYATIKERKKHQTCHKKHDTNLVREIIITKVLI